MDASYIPMFVFLLVGASCNLPFFVRSVRDLCRTSAFTAMPAAPSALLTTALAELSWVLPCLVQCALQAFNGDGPWSAARGGGGCDVMGFYSVFGSIAGMSSTLWVAVITNWPGLATARLGYLVSVAIVLSAALFAALPWMGVGRFAYTGEGFCYWDFHDTALAAVLLAATLPMLVATLALLARAAHRGGWPSQIDLYVMAASFLSAWVLWVPACLIGLGGGAFPQYYMISGGVMGHAQALINPYVYGVRWRRSSLRIDGNKEIVLDSKTGMPTVTPATKDVV